MDKNLQINTITGTLNMEKFEINTQEIKELQFPIEVKRIYIGKLSADVSYTSLTTKPIEVVLSDIIVLLGTPLNPTWDLKSLLIAEQSKIFIINKIMEFFFMLSSQQDHRNKIPKKTMKLNQMVIDIIRNIKVEVKNVHIRFEDGLSGLDAERSCQYALGVKIESLVVLPGVISTISNSTPTSPSTSNKDDNNNNSNNNNKWTPMSLITKMEAIAQHTFDGSKNLQQLCSTKTIHLNNLSIYFCDDLMMENHQDMIKLLSWDLDTKSSHRRNLLDPLSMSLSIKAFAQVATPTLFDSIDMDMTVSPIKINITTEHYRYMICTLEGIDRFDRQMLYKRSRPSVKPEVSKSIFVKGKWKPWWQYAMKCVLLDINDPAVGVSWRKTLNLLLIALQYTAIRRTIKPYIIRNKFQAPNGEFFLRYRENFEGEMCVGDYCERSHFCGGVVRGVTKFGHGIVDGIYGLVKNPMNSAMNETSIGGKTLGIMDGLVSGLTEAVVHPLEGAFELAKETAMGAAQSVAEAVKKAEETLGGEELQSEKRQAKELWLRQLAIESCLRPYVAAQLRFLADSQLDERQRRHRIKSQIHNQRDGILTISIAVVEGFHSSSTPYCVLKIGAKGSSYTGKTVNRENERTSEGKHCFPFLQTFEFHLNGTNNEDLLHLQFFDRCILFDQLLGTCLLPLNLITEKSSEGVVWEQNIKDPEHKIIANVKLTSCFQPKQSHSTLTSHDILMEHFQNHYKESQHQLYSWYAKNHEVLIKKVNFSVHLMGINLSLSYPILKDSMLVRFQECSRLEIVGIKTDLCVNLASRACSVSLKVDAVKSIFCEEPIESLSHLLVAPSNDGVFLSCEIDLKEKSSIKANAVLGDMKVVLNIPRMVQLTHRFLELPELAKLHNIMNSSFYRAVTRKTVLMISQQTIDMIVNLRLGVDVHTGVIHICIPDTTVEDRKKLIMDVLVPNLKAIAVVNDAGIAIDCSGCSVKVPQSLRDIVNSCIHMIASMKRQWFEDIKGYYLNTEMLSRHRTLRLEHQLDQQELQLGQSRAKARDFIRNPDYHKISLADVNHLKATLGDCYYHNDRKGKKLDDYPGIRNSQLLLSQSSLEVALGGTLLQQGVCVLKHNCRPTKPSWRIMWLSEDMNTLYIGRHRNSYTMSPTSLNSPNSSATNPSTSIDDPSSPKSSVVTATETSSSPQGSRRLSLTKKLWSYSIRDMIDRIQIGYECPALHMYGKETDADKYLTIYLKNCIKESVSLEFVNSSSCGLVANAIEEQLIISS